MWPSQRAPDRLFCPLASNIAKNDCLYVICRTRLIFGSVIGLGVKSRKPVCATVEFRRPAVLMHVEDHVNPIRRELEWECYAQLVRKERKRKLEDEVISILTSLNE